MCRVTREAVAASRRDFLLDQCRRILTRIMRNLMYRTQEFEPGAFADDRARSSSLFLYDAEVGLHLHEKGLNITSKAH